MWHKASFCKNERPDQFSQLLLVVTFAFRAFCALVIMSFIWERSHNPLTTVLGGAIALAIVAIDFFFTIRAFWECQQVVWERRLGMWFKLALIAMVLGYTLSIWIKISYWAYPAFGMLIVLLLFFDFILIKHNKSA